MRYQLRQQVASQHQVFQKDSTCTLARLTRSHEKVVTHQ